MTTLLRSRRVGRISRRSPDQRSDIRDFDISFRPRISHTLMRAYGCGQAAPPRLNRRRGFADYGIGGLHEPQRTRARRGRRMKSWLSFRAALALGFVASYLAIAQPAHAEKRVALVIGNN